LAVDAPVLSRIIFPKNNRSSHPPEDCEEVSVKVKSYAIMDLFNIGKAVNDMSSREESGEP
jgi:hypothetical protein